MQLTQIKQLTGTLTVDELRRIYIRQHEKFSDAPFTRWLSAANRNQQNGYRPFGWIFVQTKKPTWSPSL